MSRSYRVTPMTLEAIDGKSDIHSLRRLKDECCADIRAYLAYVEHCRKCMNCRLALWHSCCHSLHACHFKKTGEHYVYTSE